MFGRFDSVKLKASILRDSYFEFVKAFWPTVVPEEPVWNWHIPYLCGEIQEQLERVFRTKPKDHDLICNQPPATSKPVWDQSPVLMADGRYKRLRNVVVGDYVIGKSGKPCRVTAVHVQGELEAVRLETRNGRTVTAALDHPVLTAGGWRQVGQIRPGEVLALPNCPRVRARGSDRKDCEFTMAGYFIGDGSVADNGKGSSACVFANCEDFYIQDFVRCVGEMGYDYTLKPRTNPKTGITTQHVFPKTIPRMPGEKIRHPSGMGRGNFPRRGPRQWLRDTDMIGHRSKDKRVPQFVWDGTNEQVAKFIAAYFHCDGSVHRSKDGHSMSLTMVSISKGLVRDVQRLLLRLGINFRLVRRATKYGFTYNRGLAGYKSYSLNTHDTDEIAKFAERIPVGGRKRDELGDPPRTKFEGKFLGDRVQDTVRVGPLPCRCLTVEGDASFVAGDVVVHNSLIFSVFQTPWAWTRMPSFRMIGASYSFPVAEHLSRLARDVVTSDLYRKLFPEVQIRPDQNTKRFFANTKGGTRYSVGANGPVTGMHAHVVTVDDPLNPNEAASKVQLAQTNFWIGKTLLSRKVDKAVSVVQLVMQRLDEDDPTSLLLSYGSARHVCFPAELQEGYAVKPKACRRYYVRGLFDPKRLNKKSLAESLRQLGDVGYAGQYGQSPVPPGGAMFKVENISVHDAREPLPKFKSVVRFWDNAATTEKDDSRAAYTVGAKCGLTHDDQLYVLDVIRDRWDSGTRERKKRLAARRDGPDVDIGLEQEPGSGGKESALRTKRMMRGFRVHVVRPSGDKVLRAQPLSVEVNMGRVVLVAAPWNKELLRELMYFPFGRYKDQVDALSGANSLLSGGMRRAGGVRKRKDAGEVLHLWLPSKAKKNGLQTLKDTMTDEDTNLVSKLMSP